MKTDPRNHRLALSALARAALVCACLIPALLQASDAPKRELSAASPSPHAARAPTAEASREAQLERLALEAAMVDSSAFGQLRMLRDVEAKTVDATHSAGATEHCR